MKTEIFEKIASLARINAKANTAPVEEEILERREIVKFLADNKAIELAHPPESGNFSFTEKEFQDHYVEVFEERKMDNFYLLVRWPESQLLMDEEWFDSECHLANSERDDSIGSSAYFVPMKRVKNLHTKLQEI